MTLMPGLAEPFADDLRRYAAQQQAEAALDALRLKVTRRRTRLEMARFAVARWLRRLATRIEPR